MKKAFTLIEVLVVIAIVAILIGIFIPTLSGVRNSARSLLCSNNLKQTITATISYANDYKGLMPYADTPLDVRSGYNQPYESLSSYLPVVLPVLLTDTKQVITFSPYSCPSDTELAHNTGYSYTYRLWDLMLFWPTPSGKQEAVSKLLIGHEDEIIFMDYSKAFHENKVNIARYNGQISTIIVNTQE